MSRDPARILRVDPGCRIEASLSFRFHTSVLSRSFPNIGEMLPVWKRPDDTSMFRQYKTVH